MKLAVCAVLAPIAAVAMAAPPPRMPDGWSDGYVYTNGMRMHYYHAVPATGKPVIVMVHGVTDNGLCWTTLTEDLQNSYDIYMVDMRGYGLSGPLVSGAPPAGAPARPVSSSTWSLAMFGSPEVLVAQNNTSFDDLVSICGKQNSKWDPVDFSRV